MTTRTVFFRFRPTFAHAIRPNTLVFAAFAFFGQQPLLRQAHRFDRTTFGLDPAPALQDKNTGSDE